MLIIASKSANCLTTPAILYPRVLASVGTGTLSAGSAGGGTLGTLLAYDVTGCFIATTGGTGGGGTGGANNQARKIITYNTSSGAFTVAPNWETTPDATTTYGVLLPEGLTLGSLKALNPATAGRTLVVDASGLGDANVVKVGPTGSGTAQAAGDLKTLIDTLATYVDTEVAAIKTKTDNLPSDPADASDIAALLATIASYIDTEVAAIKAKTDLIPSSPAAVGSAMTLTSGERDSIAAALLDLASAIDGKTLRQAIRYIASLCVGKVSGAGTGTEVFKGLDGSTTRATVTVDNDGNRSAVTLV